MDTLMDSLMASALEQETTSEMADSESPPMEPHHFPQNGWRSADIKKCLSLTDIQYTVLYAKVEKAMCHAGLVERSLTGDRKTQLLALLDQAMPHDAVPNVRNSLRMKALQQLASRIKHNVKTKSDRAQHRKDPPSDNARGTRYVVHPEMRRPKVPPLPKTTGPKATVPHSTSPNPTATNPPPPHTAPPQALVASVGHPSGLGNMMLLSEREDHTQSTCSLRHIARNVRQGAPIGVENLSFEAWKTLLLADGVLHNPNDNASIMWKWGGREVTVPNDRVLRTVVEFMSTRGGFIEFYIKPSGQQFLGKQEGDGAYTRSRKPLTDQAKNTPQRVRDRDQSINLSNRF
ncbi:MAG: hypothetical protein Q9168_007071 [Polycauliona sp. 1 TL-2023]